MLHLQTAPKIFLPLELARSHHTSSYTLEPKSPDHDQDVGSDPIGRCLINLRGVELHETLAPMDPLEGILVAAPSLDSSGGQDGA